MSDRELPQGGGAGHEQLPEGAEAPPPGVRAMAIVRWALVALMALAALAAWVSFAGTGGRPAAQASAAAQFHCPMHPAVLEDRPGACPICGMDLVPVAAAPAGGGAAPAAPVAAAPAPAAAHAGRFWCPMHPEVSSDDPEARCPKCGGMKLLPRAAPPAAPAPAGVPGLAAVALDPARTQLIGVRTARATRQRLAAQVRAVGFVTADEKRLALVTARFTGFVQRLLVSQSGERVEKGQVLATVYSQELVSAQQVFLNSVKWADKQGSGGVQGGVEYDARKRLELLGVAAEDVAEIGRRGQPLLDVPLRAPVTGYVARKAALPGLYVQPGTELFQLADLSTVWVAADVYERDLDRVQVGQRTRLTLPSRPGETFTGRVQLVYPAVNPESRTVQARMEFRNPGLRLKPGMYADVLLDVPGVEAVTVPVDAVVDTGELQYVFLARPGGRFEPRAIRLGARGDGRVAVAEGLAEGDEVVTTANFLVDSESRLRAAVEGFRPVPAEEERREREGDDRAERARAEARN